MESNYPLHIRIALAIYLSLPLSLKARRKLRDYVFMHFGPWFASHPAYHQWRGHRDSSWTEIQKLCKQYGTARKSKAPKENDWYRLAIELGQKPRQGPVLDIIIPVYKDYNDTLRAIYNAVSAPNETPCEVIVINDKSPDKELTRILRRLGGMGLFTLLENKHNLGFVKTVNRGLKMHPDRDVIILNADCMVYGDYADRMLKVAQSRPNVASVTPLSNNGELCSYPMAWHDNAWRNEITDQKLDALCWRVNGTANVEVPTGVGYCMYMSRECMNKIGYFDADKFGRGYGEENDFCMRARAAGFVNVISGGVFVRHVGGSSFQAEKFKRIAKALKTLDALHPGYRHEIEEWRNGEPAKAMRIALDLERMKIEHRPSMLMVLHTWGGGTEKHVCDMAKWLEEEGVQVFYMMAVDGDCDSCQIGLFHKGKFQKVYTPNIRFRIKDQLEELAAFLQQLHIKHIHVNHLIGYEDDYYAELPELAKKLGVALDITLHDYFAICPRTNLIDEKNVYCGEPDVEVCNTCIQTNGSPVTRYKEDEPEVGAWREMHHRFLKAARKIYVPNKDVGKRLSNYYSDVEFIEKPHPETFMTLPKIMAKHDDSVKKIALIGALHELKGALVFKELAKDAHERNLPLEFHLFGFYAINETTLYEYGNVKETGKFKEKDLPELVAESNPDIALFLSVWPETFSYTLSQAYQLGLYPVSFDIGAPAERIRQCGWGKLLPLELAKDVGAINDALNAIEIPEKPAALAIWEKQATYPDLIRDYYKLDETLFDEVSSQPKRNAS